ncbi:hypothetical protein MRX96_018682 [Rhipicephalus microplus]
MTAPLAENVLNDCRSPHALNFPKQDTAAAWAAASRVQRSTPAGHVGTDSLRVVRVLCVCASGTVVDA